MTKGWTPETLHEHFTALREADLRLRDADQQAWRAIHEADQQTIRDFRDVMNYRLEGMNEFRDTVSDVNKQSFTRKEAWTFLIGVILAVGAIASVMSIPS